MANNKAHILILTPGFPKDENDFNCIPPLQEFLYRFKLEYPFARISVIAFQYPYDQVKYSWNGIEIYSLKGKNSKIKKPLVWLRAYIKSIRINNSYEIDIIHSLWLGECALLGNFIAKKINRMHYCTLMGQDVEANNKYLKLSKSEKIKIIALSKNQAQEFSKLTNRKVDEIIHWGIEDQDFTKTERDIDLLAVGSLIPLKNYSHFIRLIAELKLTYPNLKCKLVGTGPELTTLINVANEKGVLENIEFTGLLSRQKIFKLMQRSKILVHPSKFEGAGFVFAEALVNGMNIVSFSVGYAQNHPKWFIAKDELEFIQLTKNLLNKSLDFNPVNLFQLKETVERYASIYGIG
jgi:glycosyltransferase involved in cell wall biosynthesis